MSDPVACLFEVKFQRRSEAEVKEHPVLDTGCESINVTATDAEAAVAAVRGLVREPGQCVRAVAVRLIDEVHLITPAEAP